MSCLSWNILLLNFCINSLRSFGHDQWPHYIFKSSYCIYFRIHSPVRSHKHLHWSTCDWFASQPLLRPATRFEILFDSVFRTLLNWVDEKEKYVKADEHVSPSSTVCYTQKIALFIKKLSFHRYKISWPLAEAIGAFEGFCIGHTEWHRKYWDSQRPYNLTGTLIIPLYVRKGLMLK